MTTGPDNSAWDAAVAVHARTRQGEAEFFTTATPLTALLETEDDPETADRSSPIADVMGYLFAGTPHPAHVLHRLYVLTAEVEPALLRTLARADLQALLAAATNREGQTTPEHLIRVGMVLRGTRLERRPAKVQDQMIQSTLAVAYHRQRAKTRIPAMSLERFLRVRPGERMAEYRQRLTAMGAVLRFFFYDGPEPKQTIIRVFALAKSYHSELIHDMSVRQLGALFGVEGATWSERIKNKLNRFLEARGATGVMSRFQKSPEACAAYSRAQQGNRNRRGGEARSA